MARRAFFSFHYDADAWRASQVRNIGAIDGNKPATDNDWESVKRGGKPAIQRWIDGQLQGRSCTVVLIGAQTAKRFWVDYEIEKSWNDGKGVLGVYIHRLKDSRGNQSYKGENPFAHFSMKDGSSLAKYVSVYDPPYADSSDTYRYIANNLATWIDTAISARSV
ncbi:MAG: TIR domain-containing protein [Deltaproteobacteria bacterium]|nr:TIR domain-containing protein [Deltaproteobacteria bacterium]